MKQLFTIYRVIRIDGQFDTDKTESAEDAVAEAMTQVISEALSNAQYNGEVNSVQITDITDCGESV